MSCGTLIIRADANVVIGTGHVMRCLALAQAWQDAGGQCCFVVSEMSQVLADRLRAEGMDVYEIRTQPGGNEDGLQLCNIAADHAAVLVVVDGYQFGGEYHKIVKNAGFMLLVMDDFGHAGHYAADFVLNQNLNATEQIYEHREAFTRLLLGPRYLLLRREFASWRLWKREIPSMARKILVTMGGSDPNNVTGGVIEVIASSGLLPIEVAVIVGSDNPHLESLERVASRFPGTIRLERQCADVTLPMVWADLAVSAAGTTSWEMCALGLPAILVSIAANQSPIATALAKAGAAVSLEVDSSQKISGLSAMMVQLVNDQERRREISKIAHDLIPYGGCSRVLRAVSGKEQPDAACLPC